jgi:pantetheine-phosphate adenylyltransferase
MVLMNRVGIYPGTFDPVTSGHIDIVCRALKVVDMLTVAVAEDSVKSTIFSPEERIEMIRNHLEEEGIDTKRVQIKAFKGLLVNFAKHEKASVIIRGLRAVSDFEYEFQLSCMNSKLDDKIQTIFLPASERMQLVSSKLVKEVVRLGGNAGDFTSKFVEQKLREYYQRKS